MARLLEELTAGEKQDLVYDMVRKKTGELADEWADIVTTYDLDMSGDTLRKAGVGVKLAYDAGILRDEAEPVAQAVMTGAPPECENVDEQIGDPDYVARQKLRDLVRENNKVYRATARDELLREAVRDAVEKLGTYTPVFDFGGALESAQRFGENEMVVALGDIHFGEIMDVKGLMGERINYYDEQVCVERLNKLLRRICEIKTRESVSRVHVMVVGDCIAGMLRMSQLQNLQYGIVDSTIRFSQIFAEWIKSLVDGLCVPIDVHFVGGNHDEVRPLGSKAGDFPKDNMIKIIQWYLEAMFTSYVDLVKIHPLTGRFHYVNVCGYNFLMLHGEGGKIQDICRDAVNVYGNHVDYFVCGHLHHEEELASGTTRDGNSIIVRVPSLCGMDGYAQRLGRFSKPGATVMIREPMVGRRCVYPIELK